MSGGTTVNCGQSVTLTVSQTSAQRTGYRFTGWSGGGCSGTGACTVVTSASRSTVSVTANFSVRSCQLRLVVGSGVGSFTTTAGGRTVHSGIRSVQCGQPISYSATAGTGYCFARWGSASLGVSGQSSCRTTSGVQRLASLSADFTFTAHFTKKRYTLRITSTALRTGSGRSAGSVSPSPGSYTYAHGTRVTLTATGLFGSVWSWGGACSGSGRTCTVTMTGPRSVSVTFSPGGSGGFGEEEEEGGGPSGQAETPSATPSPIPTATPSPSASATPTPVPSATAAPSPSAAPAR